MTVTITITDPTATEASALRAYLTALRATPEWVGKRIVMQAEPPAPSLEDTADRTREAMAELSEQQATTAEDAGAPDFDSAGYPWDERIHAGSRATVADGAWRKKRGVSPEEVAAVEAELKRLCVDEGCDHHGTPHECVTPTVEAPEVPNAPAPTPDAPSPEPVEHVTASAPTPVDADAPPPPPAPTANPFLAVMSRIGKSKLDKAKKDELLTAAGALDDKGNPSILVLSKRPELIDGFVALLDSEGV